MARFVLVVLVVLATLVVAGCGDGSGSETAGRRSAAESDERSVSVVNGLATGVSILTYRGQTGGPTGLSPGGTTRSSGPASEDAARNDVCVGIFQDGRGVRVALSVVHDVMRVSTTQRCPGSRPRIDDPQVSWMAAERGSPRVLDSGIPATHLCVERLDRLAVQVRIEPIASAC